MLPRQLPDHLDQVIGRLLPVNDLLAKNPAHAKQRALLLRVPLAEADWNHTRAIQELQLGVPEATNLVPGEATRCACPVGPLGHLPAREPVDDRGLADVGEADHDGADRARVDPLPQAPAVDVRARPHDFQPEILYCFASPLGIYSDNWNSTIRLGLPDEGDSILQALRRDEVSPREDDDAGLGPHPARQVGVRRDPGDPSVAHLNDHVHTLQIILLVEVADCHCLEARPPVERNRLALETQTGGRPVSDGFEKLFG
mmetsp:Transcript_100690/g.285336  ORF Transcript_100690/g.285336 Transcript_100690/m.285336 type:complete len:257 (+) Transcript_100690:480-1250(+)